MQSTKTFSPYEEEIRALRKKRRAIRLLTVLALLALFLFLTPVSIYVMEEPVFIREGLPIPVLIILALLILFLSLLSTAVVSNVLINSLETECDPEKHMALNARFTKPKAMTANYAVDLLYLGRFEEAITYAAQMALSPDVNQSALGLYHRARAEFFLGRYDSLAASHAAFVARLSGQSRIKPRMQEEYQKMNRVLELLRAIGEKDTEKIRALRPTVKTNNGDTVAAHIFLCYVLGLASLALSDKEEAVYRLKTVTDRASKTVFATLAEEQLSALRH